MGVKTDEGQARRDEIMTYMRDFKRKHKYLPAVFQIADGTGMLRTSVAWHLQKMREQKVVDFEDGNMARSLRLL